MQDGEWSLLQPTQTHVFFEDLLFLLFFARFVCFPSLSAVVSLVSLEERSGPGSDLGFACLRQEDSESLAGAEIVFQLFYCWHDGCFSVETGV